MTRRTALRRAKQWLGETAYVQRRLPMDEDDPTVFYVVGMRTAAGTLLDMGVGGSWEDAFSHGQLPVCE